MLRKESRVPRSNGNWRIACVAIATLTWMVAGTEARAISLPDPSLGVVEVSFGGGGDFPGDLYADFDWLDIYAISECGPCGEAHFDLFDPDLGNLVSVDVAYEGALWLDDVNRYYYSDMSLGLSAGSWGDGSGNFFRADISDLVTTDGGWEARDASFSGSFSVSAGRLGAFIKRDRRSEGHVSFSGTPQVYFPTIENADFGFLGGNYSMTIRYGYEPVIAPVPLPPAALLMFGAFGALFAATRRSVRS